MALVRIEQRKAKTNKESCWTPCSWARRIKLQLNKSRQSRGWNPQLVCGMESSRRNVWNQSEGKYTCGDAIHATRNYIRLTAITYQSFELDRKKAVIKRSFFLGLEVKMTTPKNIYFLFYMLFNLIINFFCRSYLSKIYYTIALSFTSFSNHNTTKILDQKF